MTNIFDNYSFGKLPDHLVIEIFIRVPPSEWVQIACVKKHWATLFRCESLWQAALAKNYPSAAESKRWPGPIPRGLSRRLLTLYVDDPITFPLTDINIITTSNNSLFTEMASMLRFLALHISKNIIALDGEADEIVGHTYLFLKEQLQLSIMPPHSGILHGTIIDQFIACGKSRDIAHELASRIWLAVVDNLEENEQTFCLLKRLAQEGDVFLPFPYTRSVKVQWRVFEKLFTDFRDCFNGVDYYDILACAKSRFQPIPSAWLGY